jgi:hypothetical protein
MNYRMKVIITDPETPKGMVAEMMVKMNCSFFYNPKQYGNGFSLRIRSEDGRFGNDYDLRYDRSFKKAEKEKWLEKWAKNYWNGKNGAWAIKTLEITKE